MASASLWVDWWHRTQPNLTNLEDTLLVGKSFLTAPHQSPPFPKYETLTSIHRYPSRVKCAALAVEGLLQLGRDIQKS
jgi:NifU-like protein involved in Fe-S cluster formation